jgi:hypothetical protein
VFHKDIGPEKSRRGVLGLSKMMPLCVKKKKECAQGRNALYSMYIQGSYSWSLGHTWHIEEEFTDNAGLSKYSKSKMSPIINRIRI